MASVLSHPAHSPNVSPPANFAFPKLKKELKSDEYKNILETQKSARMKLKAIPIHEWKKAMKQLKNRTTECIRANGD